MRRIVRLDVGFLFALDDRLGDERSAEGTPSSADFLLIELPTIVEDFASSWDEMPRLYGGREDFRYLVVTGKLFTSAVVAGQLVDDNTVVLFDIQLEL
jgi:hypothetical protein